MNEVNKQLRLALTEAINQCVLHNEEADHRTPTLQLEEWMRVVSTYSSDEVSASTADTLWHPNPIKRMILRLLAMAETAEGQAPAIECAVMFKSGATIRGSLSLTITVPSTTAAWVDDPGMLRMLSPGLDENKQKILVEQFFDYDEVVCVALQRQISASHGSRVVLKG